MGKRPIDRLIEKGVTIAVPESVQVDAGIDPVRISGDRVALNAGCKLFGAKTYICKGVELGVEGPVTLKDCFVGPNVKLKGGYFENAVFLEGSEAGSGSHVRGGTILEEQASIAHTVGLKQTILFPHVTLGSLINLCDCLMAGGTGRKNHSEVGSSYIHFNFTPNQDKATPSMIGDVARGVMLNQSPIFLGGQGGLVGPCRIAYGTIVAAGSICRKDQMEENQLVIEAQSRSGRIPFKPGGFRHLNRIIGHNLYYIGSLCALNQWYRVIRAMFVGDRFPEPLLEGLIAILALGIDERIKQLTRLKDMVQSNVSDGGGSSAEQDFCDRWDAIEAALNNLRTHEGEMKARDSFGPIIEKQIQHFGKDYLACIKTLSPDQSEIGTRWLQSIVEQLMNHPSVQTQ